MSINERETAYDLSKLTLDERIDVFDRWVADRRREMHIAHLKLIVAVLIGVIGWASVPIVAIGFYIRDHYTR